MPDLAQWPSELPRPNRDSYAVSPGDPRRLTRPETGPLRIGRQYSQSAVTVAMTMIVSRDGRARFERFIAEEIGHGTLPFVMNAPDTDGITLTDETGVALTDETGAVLTISALWLCLIGREPPVITSTTGIRWKIAFSVEVLP
jgi:hypothetical protein